MKKRAFTLVEILVVIAIVGVIISAGFVAFGNIQVRSRDTKRLSDIKEIQNALEKYYRFEGNYPTSLMSGEALIGAKTSTTYLALVPNAPETIDGDCPSSSATYNYRSDGEHFALDYCLSDNKQSINSGEQCLTPQGEVNGNCCAYYQKDTPLVMHFDNINSNTNFTNDACASSSDINFISQSGLTTAQSAIKKFGSGSAYFPADANLKIDAPNGEFVFGTSSFTIDFWYKSETANSNINGLIGCRSADRLNEFGAFLNYPYGGHYTAGPSWTNGAGAYGGLDFYESNIITDGNWHHIAFIRSANSPKIDFYVDGYSKYLDIYGPRVDEIDPTVIEISSAYSKDPFYIDELRVTKGLIWDNTNCVTDGSARCFTPPSEAAF